VQPVRTTDISAVVVVPNVKGRMKDQNGIPPPPRLRDLVGKYLPLPSAFSKIQTPTHKSEKAEGVRLRLYKVCKSQHVGSFLNLRLYQNFTILLIEDTFLLRK